MSVFPPAKLSANRAIGNWLADLSKSPRQEDAYNEAMEADDELEVLAAYIAREITDAWVTGQRVEAAALIAGYEELLRESAPGTTTHDRAHAKLRELRGGGCDCPYCVPGSGE